MLHFFTNKRQSKKVLTNAGKCLFRGERGANSQQLLLFIVSNAAFVLIITYLWSTVFEKDLRFLREYCSFTLAFWVAAGFMVNNRPFWKDPTKTQLLSNLIACLFLFGLQFCGNVFIVSFFQKALLVEFLTRLLYGSALLALLSPTLVLWALISSLNPWLRNLCRVAWRLSFFLTPIIWFPTETMLQSRGLLVSLNPLSLVSAIFLDDVSPIGTFTWRHPTYVAVLLTCASSIIVIRQLKR